MRAVFDKEDLVKLSAAAIGAVSHVEGWDGPHPSWALRDIGFWPSHQFIKEFKRRIRKHGFVVSEKE